VSDFLAPERSLGALDAESAASVIAAAADIALIVDEKGVICDVSVSGDDLALEGYRKWVGRAWTETVSPESRPKVSSMLRDASSKTGRKWRHINHPSTQGGADVPLMYSAVQVGKQGYVVAFGRDMRSMAALQERLVEAQQSMERDYLRLRHMETRYRMLFEQASEAVLVVDATTHKVVEANPAAGQLIGEAVKRLLDRPLPDCFEAQGKQAVQTLLDGVRAAGQAGSVNARLSGGEWELTVGVSMFRQENGSLFLVRLSPVQADAPSRGASPEQSMTLLAIESAPDGFVVTDMDGRILVANPAFVDMAQLGNREQAVGDSLDRWLGRTAVDLSVLIANLKRRGSVRLFATTIRGSNGMSTPVEISGISVPHAPVPCLGFTIRDVGRRLETNRRNRKELPRSVAQLTELVGRVPLKDIVGETTDLIEQLCIEAALELTQDNRASASEMLGLSRQSLYVKLRRYGLGDLGTETEK
jgi:transcriptional regulator PpsR